VGRYRAAAHAPARRQIVQIWTTNVTIDIKGRAAQTGGSVRGYQAIFVPLAAVRSPGYSPLDGQPAVYLSVAALEVIVLN
jgi:hypothetical protein